MLTQNVIPAQNQSIPVKLPVTDQVQPVTGYKNYH